MTTFEKCCKIREMIMNRAAEVTVYGNGDNNFSAKQIRSVTENLAKQTGQEFFGIKPDEMTDKQLEELGFRKWSDKSPMMEIPLWLFPFVIDNIETECIDGSKKTKKSKMDNDNRFI